ncbi:retroviral-like aspartic protease family protein [Pseudoalteromonas luteoviolacea]|uniref:retropepsin-like aspartic protease n=1 Tax=Pseudoalteromonas luteoviolacea TaxID=43657 RepID=UPI001B387E15|nr:retropepsin-like aspartic protease [Pseudoalteromonas luteoviolacea]MBQ4812771.1 retroviral-like aspartic protease family protein [Pseudoalteromonas luteoviolacea]
MKTIFSLILLCSLSLNIYLDWQRPHSFLKSVFNDEVETVLVTHTKTNDTAKTSEKPPYQASFAPAKNHPAEQRFANGDLLGALSQWRTSTSHTQSTSTVHNWINKLKNALNSATSTALAEYLLFVQNYLSIVPNDFVALQFEAEIFVAQGERVEAIYRYIRLFQQYPEHAYLKEVITELISLELNELLEQSNWHELIEKGQIWLSEQPDNLELIAHIAKAFLALENNLEAELLLTQLSKQQQQHQLIAPLLAELNSKHQQVETIPLVRHGEHYILQARIAGQQIDLMIDTGASITALTSTQFDLLAYDVNFLTARRVSTANGVVEIPFYQSTGIQIGSKQQTPFEFGVMTSSTQGPGLLGMNFLRHFKFEIDQQNAQLILKPRQ